MMILRTDGDNEISKPDPVITSRKTLTCPTSSIMNQLSQLGQLLATGDEVTDPEEGKNRPLVQIRLGYATHSLLQQKPSSSSVKTSQPATWASSTRAP